MRKKLLLLLSLPFCAAQAQDYVPFQVTSGFTADVIADGLNPAAASTTMAVDNANYDFMSADYQANDGVTPPAYALPVSGLIESTTISGLSYQLAPYYDNNSLRIENENDYGMLSFGNPLAATKVFIMACSGSGQATMTGYIYFADNTSQEITATMIPDWFFSNALPVIASGFGRVNRLTDAVENPVGNPRLYQVTVDILPENQTKLITGMDFTKTSTAEGIINIFAVSAEALGSCPGPSDLAASSTATGGTFGWSPAVIAPANGYDYYYSTDSTPPADNQTPTATVSAGTFSVTLSGLATGQTYYVWVRSNCGGGEHGNWQPVQFTTGQIDTTYGDGDINTLYIDAATLTTESENSCPGLLYVNVPAGYQIASTAVSYDMTTASNGWKSEQRSILICNSSGLKEDAITSGTGNSGGTQSYYRDGLSIANGMVGTVEFELRSWRTFGGADCNMTYNRVVGDTFKVTVTYEPLLGIQNPEMTSVKAYPNPVKDRLQVEAPDTIVAVMLYNLQGQLVQKMSGRNTNALSVDVAVLATGVYLVKIQTVSGQQNLKISKA